jgi:hypothetical protein
MEPKVNYIVAFYGGKRRHYGDKTPIDKFIDSHINYLSSYPKHVTDFTFVFSESDNKNEKNSIKICEDFIKNSQLNGNIIIRENKAGSYGSWNDAIIKYYKNTTHSFLIEDDYIPCRLDFLDFFLKKDSTDVSFVASYCNNNHASIANGLISTKKIEETLLKYNTVFHIMDDVTYGTGLYQNQVCFLNNIKGHCVDITDIGHTLFFSGESIIPYLDENTPKLLEPILF